MFGVQMYFSASLVSLNMIDLRDNNGKASIAFDIVGSLFSFFMLLVVCSCLHTVCPS